MSFSIIFNQRKLFSPQISNFLLKNSNFLLKNSNFLLKNSNFNRKWFSHETSEKHGKKFKYSHFNRLNTENKTINLIDSTSKMFEFLQLIKIKIRNQKLIKKMRNLIKFKETETFFRYSQQNGRQKAQQSSTSNHLARCVIEFNSLLIYSLEMAGIYTEKALQNFQEIVLFTLLLCSSSLISYRELLVR